MRTLFLTLLIALPVVAQVFLPHRRVVSSIVVDTVPPPLDVVTNLPWSAYSVARRLWSGWTGGAYIVERSSDSSQQIIGFLASGAVDTNDLASFVGGGNGYTHVIYDQSGNGRHLDGYSSIINTPWVMSNGVVVVDEQGKPSSWTSPSNTFTYIVETSGSSSLSNTLFTVTTPVAISGATTDSLVNAGGSSQGSINLKGQLFSLIAFVGGTPLDSTNINNLRQYQIAGLMRSNNVEVMEVNAAAHYSAEAGDGLSSSIAVGANQATTSAEQLFSELIWYRDQADTNTWSYLNQNMIDYYDVDTGPWKFIPSSAVFDGVNDYMRLTSSGPTGLADGKTFTVSCWLNFSGGDGTQVYVFNVGDNVNGYLYLYKTTGNKVALFARNAAAATILDIAGSTSITAASGWNHVYACIDLSDTAKRKIYINGVAETLTVNTYTDDTIELVGVNYRYTFGSDSAAVVTVFLPAAGTEFWFSGSYFDSPGAFRSGSSPADLGVNGSIPTGSAPVFYSHQPGNSFGSNSGTGGDFSVTGFLNRATPP